MTTDVTLARCPVPACPWRWRTGTEDRPCPEHQADDVAYAAFTVAALLGSALGETPWPPPA